MIDTARILQGRYDSDLELIETACRQRRKLLRGTAAAMTMAAVKVGDTIRIKSTGREVLPTAKVVRKDRSELVVQFEESRGRYQEGVTVAIPISRVEIA